MKMEVLISSRIMDCSPRCCISHCAIGTSVWNPSMSVWEPFGLSSGNPLIQVTWKRHEHTQWVYWRKLWKLFMEALLEVSLAGAEAMPVEVGCSNQAEVLRWSSSLFLQSMFLSRLALTSSLTKYVRNWLITSPFPSPNKEDMEYDSSMPALVCILGPPGWGSAVSMWCCP